MNQEFPATEKPLDMLLCNNSHMHLKPQISYTWHKAYAEQTNMNEQRELSLADRTFKQVNSNCMASGAFPCTETYLTDTCLSANLEMLSIGRGKM